MKIKKKTSNVRKILRDLTIRNLTYLNLMGKIKKTMFHILTLIISNFFNSKVNFLYRQKILVWIMYWFKSLYWTPKIHWNIFQWRVINYFWQIKTIFCGIMLRSPRKLYYLKNITKKLYFNLDFYSINLQIFNCITNHFF